MTERTLIRGGWVLSLGAKTPNYNDADVLIEDDKVIEVGPDLRSRGANIVDATNSIVMPGFVDSHRHAARSLFKNLGSAAPVSREHYEPDDVYAATLVGLWGSVEAGITTMVDWADISEDPAFAEAALQAHSDVGVRTVFVAARSSGVGGLITEAFASPDVTKADLTSIVDKWSAARNSGLRIHTHVNLENTDRGVLSELHDILGDDVSLVHCSNIDEDDFDAIASSGASVALTPSSEMAGGMGLPQIQALIDRQIGPGLGIDDEQVAPGDMFAQMRATISLQHASYFDLKLAGKGGLPNLLRTREVIRYATTAGARVAGVGDVTGSLEAGKQADVIVLRADRPNIAPVNDPIGAVVWGMDTSNLDWVFVGGKALMREGAIAVDTGNVQDLAVKAQRRVAEASGLVAAGGDSV